MNKESLIEALRSTLQQLEETIAGFSSEAFNRQPFPTEWSAAQVTEHLLLLEKIAKAALRTEGIPTNRDPESKLSIIKGAMEDETKRQAPEIVKPSAGRQDVQTLLTQLKAEREKLIAAIETADLSQACKEFKHPALGTLTRWEWAWFTVYHTDRHRKQVEKIREQVLQAPAC